MSSSFHGVTIVSKPRAAGYASRVGLVQLTGDLPQLGLRLFGRGAGSEARIDVGHAMRAAVLHRRAHVVVVGRVVDVEVLLPLGRIMRAWCEHADDLRLLDRQIQRLSDDVRIRSEDALPVRVGEHGHRRRALVLVREHEHAAQLRLRAQHREEVRRHQSAGGAMRLAAAEHVEGPVAEFDELIDGL